MINVTDCVCLHPPFHYRDYNSRLLGTDETKGRYAEVSVETCRKCGRLWLKYAVEYEGFSGSGRWYRGLISSGEAETVTPQNAQVVLEGLEWYFCGGTFLGSTGRLGQGKIWVDL